MVGSHAIINFSLMLQELIHEHLLELFWDNKEYIAATMERKALHSENLGEYHQRLENKMNYIDKELNTSRQTSSLLQLNGHVSSKCSRRWRQKESNWAQGDTPWGEHLAFMSTMFMLLDSSYNSDVSICFFSMVGTHAIISFSLMLLQIHLNNTCFCTLKGPQSRSSTQTVLP